MSYDETATWLEYDFVVCVYEDDWPETPGIYAFAHRIPEDPGWQLLYVGQTESFDTRLPNHERWQEAVDQGATHVHLLVFEHAHGREAFEKRMIEEYRPLLNFVYRPDV
jgi:excinuclease UvrABC nuclease subunit